MHSKHFLQETESFSLLECEDVCAIPSGNMIELWLQGCLKWFPELHVNKGKCGASAILHTGSSPIFVVFFYAFSDQKWVKPKLTAYASEKKVIAVKFFRNLSEGYLWN